MLIHLKAYPCFNQQGHRYSCWLACTSLSSSACLNVVDVTAVHKSHLKAKRNNKEFRYIKSTSPIMVKLESDNTKEEFQDLSSSYTYDMAMESLSSLITRQKRGEKPIAVSKYGKLERMLMYIKILGLEEHIARLKIIHVAGTKGKGSTCTFCEAILREYGFRTGLFTSPHLTDVRERFRLDGVDISQDKFLLYFWDCWNHLKEHVTEELPMPPLFQFLTVLAFKIFVAENVDVAIVEVGLGGKEDSTNVIEKPVVCGITSLGMDHMETLGDTLAKIASHKAGILKPGVPAFTAPQLSEAMDIIQEKARDLMIPLEVVAPLDYNILDGTKLRLSGDHQLINAGLAVSLCKSWLFRTGNWGKSLENDELQGKLPKAFLRGLSTAHLPGRAQIVHDILSRPYSSSDVGSKSSGDLIFYLDGAHSPESMDVCARWYSNAVKVFKNDPSSMLRVENREDLLGNGCAQNEMEKESGRISKQILLFNCMEMRDPQILIPRLVNGCASSGTHFSRAIFVPSMSTYTKVTSSTSAIPSDLPPRDLSWQFNLQKIWEKMIHGRDVVVDRSSNSDSVQHTPSHDFLLADASQCNPADRSFACSAVIPSLPLTIKWLRDCVRENPSVRIQVLVTGSIHLVGDVLKLLKR